MNQELLKVILTIVVPLIFVLSFFLLVYLMDKKAKDLGSKSRNH